MPKATFYHLPEEKRQRVENAIKEEFLAHSYENVSLNRIIKTAEISRGSIYQYFDGKEDMFGFLMEEYSEIVIHLVEETLKKNQGDLFASFEEAVPIIFLGSGQNGEGDFRVLLSNREAVMLFLQGNADEKSDFTNRKKHVINAIWEKIDFTKLSLIDEEEQHYFIDILVDIIIKHLISYLNDDNMTNLEDCQKKVNLLRRRFERT